MRSFVRVTILIDGRPPQLNVIEAPHEGAVRVLVEGFNEPESSPPVRTARTDLSVGRAPASVALENVPL